MITDFNFKLKFSPTEMLENRLWETIEIMRSALIPMGLIGCTDEYPDGVGHIGRKLIGNHFVISGRGTSVLEQLDWSLYSLVATELKNEFLVAKGLIAPPWEAYLIQGMMINPNICINSFVVTRNGGVTPDEVVCKYNDTLEGCRQVLSAEKLPEEGIIGVEGVPGMVIAYGKMIDSVCIKLVNRLKQ